MNVVLERTYLCGDFEIVLWDVIMENQMSKTAYRQDPAINALLSSSIKSFREINDIYDKISNELEDLSRLDPESEQMQKENYARLSTQQDRLVLLALNLEIKGLKDVKDKLKFWYKIAVSERAEDDLLKTDYFVMSICHYFSALDCILEDGDDVKW